MNFNEFSDGTEDFKFRELTILIQDSDFQLINHLKNQNNISQDELRDVGSILIQGLRGFCE